MGGKRTIKSVCCLCALPPLAARPWTGSEGFFNSLGRQGLCVIYRVWLGAAWPPWRWLRARPQRLRQTSRWKKSNTRGVITIGYRASAAPFSFDAAPGKPAGYAIDICQRLVAQLREQLHLPSLQVRYVLVNAAERVAKLDSGEMQMECSDSTNTKERREQAAFAPAYYYAGTRLLVRADDSADSLAQMDGRSVAVIAGSTGQAIAKARKDAGVNLNIIEVPNAAAGVRAVVEKRADGTLSDDIVLLDQAKMLKDTVKVVGPKLSVEPLAIMLPRHSPDFRNLKIGRAHV